MKVKKKFQSKAKMRAAQRAIAEAVALVESIREHFDMEWGANSHSQLDVALTVGVIRKLDSATSELTDLLLKYRGRAVAPNFPPGPKPPKPAITVRDLQKALVC